MGVRWTDGLIPRARRTRTCRAEPNPAAHARDRHVHASVTPQRTRSHIATTRLCNRCTYISDVCVAISIGGRTHTKVVNGRIGSTRNRTHVCMEAMQPHARAYLYFTEAVIDIYLYMSDPSAAIYRRRHTHARTLMRAPMHRRTHACASTACPNSDPH